MLAKTPILTVFARAALPTRHGDLEIVAFCDDAGKTIDDVAVVRGDVLGKSHVNTRVHSECLTGDVFASLRCDCRDQLELALGRVVQESCGLILYLRQEGRGIGIANKVKAYELQQNGFDTMEANHHLGFDADLRSYEIAAAMLHALQVDSIVLHTNNPEKIRGLEECGVVVEHRQAILAEPGDGNRIYLQTKFDKMGHMH